MLKNEVWKTYQEFDFIQASNLGRYRTITREVSCKNGSKRIVPGRVLKPQRTNRGYLSLGLRANGKYVTRLAHRVTAETFIPNPDGFPEVNHINSNRTDNCVENLEWVTPEQNIAHREKYGTALDRPLLAYDLETFEEWRFESQHEASRELGIAQPSICNVIKGKLKQAGGYYFTEDKSEITKEKLQSIKDSMGNRVSVIAINLKTQEPLRFKSHKEAADVLKCSHGNISSVLTGRYKSTGGYWFTKADENTIEAVRAKFGDYMADKVSDLLKDEELV